jgi:hypothetical protein
MNVEVFAMTLKERIERFEVPENMVAIWGLGQTGRCAQRWWLHRLH